MNLQSQYMPQFWAVEQDAPARIYPNRGGTTAAATTTGNVTKFWEQGTADVQQSQMQRGWTRGWAFQDQTRTMQWG
jgi:uncharacterized protein YgiM (DUF1202 family)